MELYAIYDKISKRLAEPFRAENDEVAKRKFLQTLKEMKKHDMDTEDLTVYRIAEYKDTPVLEKDEKGLTGYADIVTDLVAYDLYNVPEERKIKKEEEDITFETAKKMVKNE